MSELRTEDFLCKFAEIFLSRSLAVITFNSKEWEGEKKEKKKKRTSQWHKTEWLKNLMVQKENAQSG